MVPHEVSPKVGRTVPTELEKMAVLIRQRRQLLLSNWRQQVRELSSAERLTNPALTDHIPKLLDELVDELRERAGKSHKKPANSAPAHGLQRADLDFDIQEVVAEYDVLRMCIHELAEANGIALRGEAFRVINMRIDKSIGSALNAYVIRRTLQAQHQRERHLAFVAHDLRTPLSAISLSANVLDHYLQNADGPPDIGRALKALSRNVRYLQRLVDNVLKENTDLMTEMGVKVEHREFDLWPLIESLLHQLQPVAGAANTALRNEVPEDLTIRADASLLKRVFQNLAANAIRHTPEGVVTIGAAVEGGSIQCWVKDTGEGMSPAQLEALGKAAAGDRVPGRESGLGLEIVRTFIEAQGGSVRFESKMGKGTSIYLTLPAGDPPGD
jgi:signal transduction histidine kinase